MKKFYLIFVFVVALFAVSCEEKSEKRPPLPDDYVLPENMFYQSDWAGSIVWLYEGESHKAEVGIRFSAETGYCVTKFAEEQDIYENYMEFNYVQQDNALAVESRSRYEKGVLEGAWLLKDVVDGTYVFSKYEYTSSEATLSIRRE